MCPITQELMTEPVVTVDGHTYEKHAIETWFAAHSTSPLTGLPLASTALTPNQRLQQQIGIWLQDNPQAQSDPLADRHPP